MGVALDGLNDLMAVYDQPDAPSPTAAPSYRQALPLLRETFAEIASETAVAVTDDVDSVGLLKFAAVRLRFNHAFPGGVIGVETIFPAGTAIVDVKVFVETVFDDATSNAILFGYTNDFVSASPLTVPFAQCDDLTLARGRPVTGVDFFGVELPQFTPVYDPGRFGVIAAFSGAAPTQGQALIVYTIAAI